MAATSTTASRPSVASSAPVAGHRETRSRRSRPSSSRCSSPSRPRPAARSTLDLKLVRGAYSIDPEHELSRALRAGYRDVTGAELPLEGLKVVADAAVFEGVAAIPTVYHGPAGSGAHGRRRVRARRRARARDAGVSEHAPAPLDAVSEPVPSYADLRASFRWRAPRCRQHRRRGVGPAARRPHRRSSSRTAGRSPAPSPSAS